jgi:hypothetical protein
MKLRGHPELVKLARPCWRKERHETQGKAKAHLRSLRRQDRVVGADALTEYQCRECGGWHIGHDRKRNKEDR